MFNSLFPHYFTSALLTLLLGKPAWLNAGLRVFTYLPRILLTQPWLTRSCLEMSQGRTPWWASSTIRCLTTSGRGLPFTNTPPSWFTPPCPTWDTTATPQTDVTLHKVVIDRKVQAGKYLKKIISGRKKSRSKGVCNISE